MKKKLNLLLLLICCLVIFLIGCNKADNKSSNKNQATEAKDQNSKEGDSDLSQSELDAKPRDNISIQYIGNSCFYIEFMDGTRLVCDPYGKNFTSQFGEIPEVYADVITVSHTHTDHTGVGSIRGTDNVFLQLQDLTEPKQVGDVTISAFDGKHVANMGSNTIFVYEENGFKIANLGETDNVDSKEAQDAIKDADVVLVYAGQYGDIKNKENFKNLENLGVKVMIPEHYSMSADQIFYNEPTVDQILLDVPEDYETKTQDEYIVEKTDDKMFVVLNKMQ